MRSALFVPARAVDLSATLCPKPAPRFQHVPARARRQAGHRHCFSCGGVLALNINLATWESVLLLPRIKRNSTDFLPANPKSIPLAYYSPFILPAPPPAKLRAALRAAACSWDLGLPCGTKGARPARSPAPPGRGGAAPLPAHGRCRLRARPGGGGDDPCESGMSALAERPCAAVPVPVPVPVHRPHLLAQ